MKYSVAIVVSLAVIGAAALGVTAGSVSTNLAKAEVVERLRVWTGGSAVHAGEPVVTVFPSVGVHVTNVAASLPGSTDDQPILTIPSVDASLRLLPLLVGRVEVRSLTLVDPRIRLVVDEDGNKNWAGISIWRTLGGGGLGGEITVTGGTITFEDRRTGRFEELTAADFRLDWRQPAQPLALSGAFAWHDRMVKFDAALDSPIATIDGTGSHGRLTLAAEPVPPTTEETIDSVEGPDTGMEDGVIPPYLWRLSRWLGIPVAPGSSFGPLSVAGTLRADKASIVISGASVELNGGAAEGALALALDGRRPRLWGSLAFDQLDVGPQATALLPADGSVGELFALPVSAEWLSYADIDLRASADRVDLAGGRFTDATATLAVQDGRMTLTLEDAGFADGRVRGEVTVRPADRGIAAALSARLDRVSVADAGWLVWTAYANQLLGTEIPLLGTGTAVVDLAAEGATLNALVGSLSGRIVADIRDGAIDGVDIGSTLDGLAENETVIPSGEAPFLPVVGRTYFASLEARVSIEAGLARAEQVRVVGDQFEVTLSGEGDLKRTEIEAEGKALRFAPAEEDGDPGPRPVVELPFGVGGTMREPVLVPGIPRIGDSAEGTGANTPFPRLVNTDQARTTASPCAGC